MFEQAININKSLALSYFRSDFSTPEPGGVADNSLLHSYSFVSLLVEG